MGDRQLRQGHTAAAAVLELVVLLTQPSSDGITGITSPTALWPSLRFPLCLWFSRVWVGCLCVVLLLKANKVTNLLVGDFPYWKFPITYSSSHCSKYVLSVFLLGFPPKPFHHVPYYFSIFWIFHLPVLYKFWTYINFTNLFSSSLGLASPLSIEFEI